MSIVVEDLTVQVQGREGPVTLLENISLELTAPRTAVIGENGSGKSTLTKAVAGLLRPQAGRIRVNGLDTVAEAKRLRRAVGFVFAHPGSQVIMPVVHEDVALTLKGRGLGKAEIARRVDLALEEHGLSGLRDHSCMSLSSGQMQRLALCSVLVGEPELVIADEPTSLLDARNRRIVADRLLAPAADQVLLVTHDLDLARQCDEAVLIHRGKVWAHGSPDGVLAAYEEILADD